MIPLLRFHVLDSSLNMLGQFNSYNYAKWSEDYAGLGSMEIQCVDTDENVKLMQPGNIVYRHDIQRGMVIRRNQFIQFEGRLIAYGYTTSDLLTQRVINPSDTVHMMEINNVEQGMYDIVNTNSRGMTNFTTAPLKGYTETFVTQFTGTKAPNALISLADEVEFGFYTTTDITNKRHIFTVYKGADRTAGTSGQIIFRDDPPNVNNLVITNDFTEYANLVYMAGEGEGEDRIVVTVPTTPPTGVTSYELWQDARNVRRDGQSLTKYRQILYNKGVEILNQRAKTLSFTADPITEGGYEFRKDYDLGDQVTCLSRKYGIQFNTRVEQITEIAQYNSTVIKVQLGKPLGYYTREVE